MCRRSAPLTQQAADATLGAVRFFTRSVVRTLPMVVALSFAGSPVAECFAPPPGAEMPCCADGRHETCHHDENPGAVVQCCRQAQVQESSGVTVAKPHATTSQFVAVLSPVVAAPGLSQIPVIHPVTFDTGPPGRSTRLHIVLSVFLI